MENPFEQPRSGGAGSLAAVSSEQRILIGFWLFLGVMMIPLLTTTLTTTLTVLIRGEEVPRFFIWVTALSFLELAMRVPAAFLITDPESNKKPKTISGALRIVAVFSIVSFLMRFASSPLEAYGAQSLSLILTWIARLVYWAFVVLVVLRLDQIARTFHPKLARGRVILVLYFAAAFSALTLTPQSSLWEREQWRVMLQAGASLAAWVLGVTYLLILITVARRARAAAQPEQS